METTLLEAVASDAHTQAGVLRFITAGSVDDGKSTLIGRLLHDSRAISRCRRVCGSSPLVTSTKSTIASELLAPVAMLRVYCSCPGESAMMNLRRGVAKYR